MNLLLGCAEPAADAPEALGVEVVTEARCADPDARAGAELVSWSLGADWEEQEAVDDTLSQYGSGGMAVADFNGDDVADLYLPSSGVAQLFLSQGDLSWVNEAADRLPDESGLIGVGGVAADYDADGDLDLFTLVLHGPDRLYRNDGSGRMEDVTAAAGLAELDDDTVHATWADVDGDADLDLVVANHYEGEHLADALLSGDFPPAHDNRLYRNDGDGRFTDLTGQLPAVFREGYSFVIVAEDLDGDGRVELYAVNDFGYAATPDVVIEPEGEGWVVDDDLVGLDLELFGMGAGLGDLNGDGVTDMLLSNLGAQVLLESDGAGGWYQSAAARGLVTTAEQTTAWSVVLEDLDNDGDLDAAQAFGELNMPEDFEALFTEATGVAPVHEQPDALFRQDGGLFTDVAPAWGADARQMGRGLLAVDLDGDGWLDLVRRDLDGQTEVLRAACGAEQGLSVELRDPTGPNPRGVGASVRVEVDGIERSRILRAGGESHASGGPLAVHFGLGDAATATIEVTWPDGAVGVAEDVPAGRVRLVRD